MKNKGIKNQQTVLDLLKKVARGEEFDFVVDGGDKRFQVRNGRLYGDGEPQKWFIYEEWLNKEAKIVKKKELVADSNMKGIIEALEKLVKELDKTEE